jgi:hypothetical protein
MKLLHLQLFWYEKHHTLLEMEDLPTLSPQQERELQEWGKSRRKILNYEVHQHLWIKVNSEGFSSILELLPNGKLSEKDLFGQRHLRGFWKLNNGLLFIKVVSGEFIIEYHIIGHKKTNIHSGIEYINGKVSSFSKFVKVSD